METYLLNSAGCLAILLLFYKLLLENETMHQFKRFYLLGSLFAAMVIPLITFTTYTQVIPQNLQQISNPSVLISEGAPIKMVNWIGILWTVYGLGVLIFSVKFIRNLKTLILRIKHNLKLKNKDFTNVLLREKIVPHTFFSFLFFNKDAFFKKQIPKEVIVHEEAHAKQLHSLDVLIVELLQIVFWFNPLIYLAKYAIKLNHEFLADRSVICKGVETSQYQRTLLAFSSNAPSSKLANAFNYSSIKKRFTVMKTHTSNRTIWSKGLLLLPLLAILLFSFSSKEVIEKEVAYLNISDLETPHYKKSLDQEIATKKMVKEYNALAKKYNGTDPGELLVKHEEFKRMSYIYDLMTPEQRSNAEKFPKIIPPPAHAPEAPHAPHAPHVVHPVEGAAPPLAPQVEIEIFEMDGDSGLMPPPPPPVPAEHMKELADEGAEFYLNGKKITAEEAIKLAKGDKLLTIDVRKLDDSPTTVKLSTMPKDKN
jgi:hypothetical protein